MTGMSNYTTIKEAERLADNLGMKLARSKYSMGSDLVALIPTGGDDDADRKLPLYSRDTELMTGSFEDLIKFMQGWDRATQYFTMLKLVDAKKIEKKENLYKQERLLNALKNEEKKSS